MSRLHELLAAEKTPTAAWHHMLGETMKKFKNAAHYFEGHSKSLKMIEETPANSAIEAQAREEKPVATTVLDTLEYALDVFGKAEDLQFQKNSTNRHAVGTVSIEGEITLTDMPVDELLGLEARLAKIRELIDAVPTLDASRHWVHDDNAGANVWSTRYPEETTKTEKQLVPIVMHEATVEHPAQVQAVTRDAVVGKFTMVKRSGAATALQKAEAIKRIDRLVVEVKKARMRANETEVDDCSISQALVDYILKPFREETEGHQ